MKTLLCSAGLAFASLATQISAQGSHTGRAFDAEIQLVQARTIEDVILQLEQAGLSIDDITRTFLGRIRVVASNRTTVREIVMSRATGEILSDVIRNRRSGDDDENVASGSGTPASNGLAGENTAGPGDPGSAASGGRSDAARNNPSRSNGGASAGNRSN